MDSKCIWCGKKVWREEDWVWWSQDRFYGVSAPPPTDLCECEEWIDYDLGNLAIDEEMYGKKDPVMMYKRNVDAERKEVA